MASIKPILSVGVTGTPGCGKTTFCNNSGIPVIDLNEYAEKFDCLSDVDEYGIREMDLDRLKLLWKPPTELTLYDGHLAHYMPVDAIIVLRCEPLELKQRLEARGYSEWKVKQNVEVEMLGGPWNDLVTDSRPIFEGEIGAINWIKSGCPKHTTPDLAVDWLSRP